MVDDERPQQSEEVAADSPVFVPARPARSPGDALHRLDEVLHEAVARRVFPGAAVACGSCGYPARSGLQYFSKGYGTHTYECNSPTTPHSIFDVASLTKVMATVPAVMLLYEAGKLDLQAPVCRYLPAFASNGKEAITVEHLLTHTAGLAAFYPFHAMRLRTRQAIVQFICDDEPRHPLGSTKYSDLSMIILGEIVERLSGRPLDRYVAHAVFRPLGMHSTGFRPLPEGGEAEGAADPSVVPTEVNMDWRRRLIWGEVHDPNAYTMGGVAGHAGLFSTAADMARFCYTMLAGGVTPDGRRLFHAATVAKFTSRGAPSSATHQRALGWDLKPKARGAFTSSGHRMSARAYGHTGFTGTSMWLDPRSKRFVVLLSNSVHPWAHATPVDAVPLVRAATADAAMDLLATAARRERRGDRPAFHHHHSHCDITGVELTPPPPVACAVLPNAAGPRGLLSTSVVGLSAATPSPLYDATRPLQLQQYVVCAGDTVGRLAGQRGMSVAEVQALNPTIDVDVIDVGQRLWLVDPPRLAERPVEAYTVKQDDRLPVLAYRHDMTMGDVARLNPTLGENAVTAAVGTMLLLHPSLTDHGGLVPSGLGYVATESPPWIPLSVSDPTGDAADATTGEAREAAAVARRSSGSAAVSSAPVIQDDATLDVVDAGSGSESEDEDEDSGVDDDGTHVYQAPSGPAAGIPALLSGDSAAEVVRAPMCAGGQAQYWHRYCEPKRRAGPHGHERRATSNATPTATNRARWLQLVVAAGVAVAALVSRRLD